MKSNIQNPNPALKTALISYFICMKYISEVFFEQHEKGDGAELYFYISLINKFGMFDCKRKHYHPLIRSAYYDCTCGRMTINGTG